VGAIATGLLSVNTACAMPLAKTRPRIVGTAAYGQVVRCARGRWTGYEARFSYQWITNAEPGGVEVGRAPTLRVPDVIGDQLTCAVTATDIAGVTTVRSRSVEVTAGLTSVEIWQVRTAPRRVVVSGQVQPAGSTTYGNATGQVELGLEQPGGGLQVLSATAVNVAPNGDFTISARASGRHQWAIAYYPASTLWRPVIRLTAPVRVPL
jgi:hypothetical protein